MNPVVARSFCVRSLFVAVVLLSAWRASPLTAAPQDGQQESKPALHLSAPQVVETTLAAANSSDFAITLQIENPAENEVLIWPYLSVELLDADGKPVKRSRGLGRWGRRKTPSIIEGIKFPAIAAKASHDININLQHYSWDPGMLIGWKLTAPGDYTLKLHYNFDRAAIKTRYGKGCENLDGADQPWNKAREIDQTLEVKLHVK